MSDHTPESDQLTKNDLRVLNRLAKEKRAALRRKPDTTADVLGAYEALILRLDLAIATSPMSVAPADRPNGGA